MEETSVYFYWLTYLILLRRFIERYLPLFLYPFSLLLSTYLRSRYNVPTQRLDDNAAQVVRVRVVNMLCEWLMKHPSDFSHPIILFSLRGFISRLPKPHATLLSRYLSVLNSLSFSPFDLPSPLFSLHLDWLLFFVIFPFLFFSFPSFQAATTEPAVRRPRVPREPTVVIRLLDLPSDEVARQLTLVDFEFYSAVHVCHSSPICSRITCNPLNWCMLGQQVHQIYFSFFFIL